MDLDYVAYLARTIPPRELARALAVRARRALGVPAEHVAAPDEQEKRRQKLYARAAQRPALVHVSQREEIARLLAGQCEDVLHEAREARRGSLLLFGEYVDCKNPVNYLRDPLKPDVTYDARTKAEEVDLFVPGADAKAMWEVGRLVQLWRHAQARVLTGEREWSQAWMDELRNFRAQNPKGQGVQWACAMEVSLRACNIATSFALLSDEVEPAEVIECLDEHCEYVSRHLEETGAVRTNHYAADLVGLVVCGTLFPELSHWHDAFAQRLWDEIPRQCRADGTHFEASLGYQRLCAEMFVLALLCAREAGKPAPPEVETAVRGLFVSLTQTLKPNGEIPQVGDLDSCRALPFKPRSALDSSYIPGVGAAAFHESDLASGECPPEVIWLLGPAGALRYSPRAVSQGSVALRAAGLAVLRSGDAYLCLSAGPNGQGGTGGHAHNDKNSIELSFGSTDIVLDRGTFVYARDPDQRNARRGTAGHSTVQVDGLEQNRIIPGRLFALPDTAHARLTAIGSHEGFETATGEHAGFARGGVKLHRRVVALRHDAAALQDELTGEGEHSVVSRLYLPFAQVTPRAATPAEIVRLEELHERGFAFGYDFQRCLEIGGALLAFGATAPWQLEVTKSDVSQGYAELRPATRVELTLFARMTVKIFTAVLRLPQQAAGA